MLHDPFIHTKNTFEVEKRREEKKKNKKSFNRIIFSVVVVSFWLLVVALTAFPNISTFCLGFLGFTTDQNRCRN